MIKFFSNEKHKHFAMEIFKKSVVKIFDVFSNVCFLNKLRVFATMLCVILLSVFIFLLLNFDSSGLKIVKSVWVNFTNAEKFFLIG